MIWTVNNVLGNIYLFITQNEKKVNIFRDVIDSLDCISLLICLTFISGVTIVKVGGNSYGSKGELSYKSGSRHEISATTTATSTTTSTPAPPITTNNNTNNNNNTGQNTTVNNTAVRNTTVNGRKSESRSTGRLPTHRSMTRLNNFDATRPPSSGGLHKSMTKLTSSQQNMARSSSQMVAAPTAR